MDELGHDVIMTIILSKYVLIGDDFATISTAGTRYFILPQDYIPEWTDPDQRQNGARGRIQAMQYDQVKFTTNCNTP